MNNPWDEGYIAGKEGKLTMVDNPYTNAFLEDFTNWFAGWCAGRKALSTTPAGKPSEPDHD